ncbi:MAG: orotidine-5'-phosphate decarboxylase [Pirellulales bacterium]|nr:orotidine-5'-phosphate decarboxylase [Pirellulales bacterium]
MDQPNSIRPFSRRLHEAVRRCRNPVVVGLDPRIEQIPVPLRPTGSSLAARADACKQFCCGVIDAVAALVPAVKPQVAFFEALGTPGIQSLIDVISHARSAGLLVIADAKRGDIGSTAEAYADAWLGASAATGYGGDALTINPYLGNDSLEPFVTVARERGAGLFVLVKTSNPGGGQFQDLAVQGNETVYRHVATFVEHLAVHSRGDNQYGDIGAVVGATYAAQLTELRVAMPHAWLLVPGYGSQGAGAREVAGGFDGQGLGAVINNSRGLIYAHAREPFASRYGASQWQSAVRAATEEMIAELRAETTVGRL